MFIFHIFLFILTACFCGKEFRETLCGTGRITGLSKAFAQHHSNTTLTLEVWWQWVYNESNFYSFVISSHRYSAFYYTELSFASRWLFHIVFTSFKILGEPGNVNMNGKAGYWSCQRKCLRYVIRLKSNIGYFYSTGARCNIQFWFRDVRRFRSHDWRCDDACLCVFAYYF